MEQVAARDRNRMDSLDDRGDRSDHGDRSERVTSGGLPLRSGTVRLAPLVDKKRRDSKRDALLAAAREEFAACGFLGTHIAVVATRVGIRKSTFFHYFDGKEALYDAAVGAVLDDVVAAVDASAPSSGLFGERLDATIACLMQHFEVDASLSRLMLRTLVDGPPPGTPRPFAMDRLASRIAEIVGSGVRDGRVPACDVQRMSLCVLGLVCLQHRTATTPLEMPESEPLIGMTSSIRLADVKAQVRRLLAVG
jgi:AcrR family transcriptional regulator